jgi:hypothetical protein
VPPPLLAAATAGLIAASGGAAAPNAPPPTRAGNKAAAGQDAHALLGLLQLPPGATPSATEPAGDDGVLSSPGVGAPATPTLVDDSAFWTVAGTPASVIAYVKAHAPAGSTLSTGGTGSQPGKPTTTSLGYALPALPGVISSRVLAITVAPLPDGLIAVRADGEVVWIIPRPASEHIPPAAEVTVAVIDPGVPASKLPRPRVITSRRTIEALTATLNALPLFPPGIFSCPADRDAAILLTFAPTRGGTAEAVATIRLGGCGGVSLKLRGHTEPFLSSTGLPGSPHSITGHLLVPLFNDALHPGHAGAIHAP